MSSSWARYFSPEFLAIEIVLYIYVGSMVITIIGFFLVPELNRRPVCHFVHEVPA